MGNSKIPWTIAILAMTALSRADAAGPSLVDTRDPVLENLVAGAFGRNPDARSAEASAEAATYRIAPARTLPDPFLSLGYQNDGRRFTLGTRDMTFLGATISQPFPWPGKLKLAGEIAESESKQNEREVLGRTRRAVEARVRRAFYDWQLSRALLDLVEERRAAWRQIEEVARDRYSAGLAIQQDVLRAQVELLRLDEEAAVRSAAVSARLAELDRAAGRPQDAPIEEAKPLSLDTSLPDLPEVIERLRREHPELAGGEAAIETGRLRVALARRNFLPDLVASAGPMYRGALDPMWQVGLGISLPIHSGSRQRHQLREAEANLRAGQAQLASAEQELEFRTRERYETLQGVLRGARIYRDGVIPTDQISLESAMASYRSGRTPFVTVIEALNALYADRSGLLGRLAEAQKLRVAIEEADLGAGAAMPSAGVATGAMSNAGEPGGSPNPMR